MKAADRADLLNLVYEAKSKCVIFFFPLLGEILPFFMVGGSEHVVGWLRKTRCL